MIRNTRDRQKENIILEIRAGTGGEEAGLFAADLFRMYTRYAQSRGWQVRGSNPNEGGIRNVKSGTTEISGDDVYKSLKYESGVHRVQRVPTTETSGRIHTSTATVAVLPKISQREVEIKPNELKIDFYRATGHGGQNVNKVETAVRITHLPTGVVVACQDERSQHQNREKAMEILRSHLYEMLQRQKKDKVAQLRREQVGGAERAEKIRTYNFPQNRITDHRLGKSWHDLQRILDGDLDTILKNFKQR